MKMIEDFKNMVEKSLNLSEPWYVKGAEFHADEPAIHIRACSHKVLDKQIKKW